MFTNKEEIGRKLRSRLDLSKYVNVQAMDEK